MPSWSLVSHTNALSPLQCEHISCLSHAGIGMEDAKTLVKAAETCCEEDIYHFDDTERFFLVSCLALWWVVLLITMHVQSSEPMTFDRHARQGNHTSADNYQKIAQGKRLHSTEQDPLHTASLL